ncbi:MAG: restriction endonuclease [Candidatus Eremiobacter antarcticus]|nr:HNH endonuclease [Candidatus Eremiobacteraeota bacterium]MBC5807455.1 HNH endonuclease [Candidatus Eremiobacteraeota bacterium]PZR61502.1 MAG: restriction endonuclease [Candidatus Eremiobacter sp. RRmetagenome_bin22]
MKFYVAVTDDSWFNYLHALSPLPDEVNFWTGIPVREEPGTPWLFKLHAPNNFIVGGGYFTYYTQMPLTTVWDAFGPLNGVDSLSTLQQRIGQYRKEAISLTTSIGCAVLSQPFFWERERWLPVPTDWSRNIVSRKSYDSETSIGSQLWQGVTQRLPRPVSQLGESVPGGFGKPQIVRPRINQGAFRLMVTDAYHRSCAVSREKALPALEAAHILPFSEAPTHEVRNGLLLRADIHRLFDLGYVTVTPDYRFLVSKTIHDDFANGREYYALHGNSIALPDRLASYPDPTLLEQHVSEKFRG